MKRLHKLLAFLTVILAQVLCLGLTAFSQESPPEWEYPEDHFPPELQELLDFFKENPHLIPEDFGLPHSPVPRGRYHELRGDLDDLRYQGGSFEPAPVEPAPVVQADPENWLSIFLEGFKQWFIRLLSEPLGPDQYFQLELPPVDG